MTELFDTHAHFEGTRAETDAAVARAREAGVTRIMAVGGSESLNAGTEGFEFRAIGWRRGSFPRSTTRAFRLSERSGSTTTTPRRPALRRWISSLGSWSLRGRSDSPW